MGERVKQQLPFLQFLTICSDKQVQALLDTISEDQANAISAIFKNIHLKNIPISKRDETVLFKKIKSIILLTSSDSSYSKRASIIKTEASLIIHILKKNIDEIIDILE